MTSTKSVFVLLGVGTVGACIAAGCSASSPTGFGEAPAEKETVLPSNPAKGKDASTGPTSQNDASDTKEDASVNPRDAEADTFVPEKDAEAEASVDATTDAGADASTDPPGSPCATNGLVGQQACGLCGFQTRLCAMSDDALVWQPWGFCQNEVVGGCTPGTSGTEDCGLCGTRNKVCQTDCHYAVGACRGEPVGACKPGKVEFQTGLSCDVGGRKRTCGPTCAFGDYGDCVVPAAATLELASTAGGETSGEFSLSPDTKIGRLSGLCPNSTVGTAKTSYQYVTLVNTTAQNAVAWVWTSKSANAGAAEPDMVMASYAGDTAPTTDAARKTCEKGVNDSCFEDECTDAGLVAANAVTIGPNGKAVVYVAAFSSTASGDYKLNTRVITLE